MATKAETETTITWNLDDERATVYSLMPRIWRLCMNAGGEEINLDHGVRDGKKAARTFLVDVGTIKIRRKRVMTPEQREKAKERGRNLAAGKMGL